MFVGHYSAAFAARALRPDIPLWLLFVAVQLIDYAFMLFIMLNIEQVRVVPGFTEASALDLYFMPFTHSLAAVAIWSVAAGVLFAGLKTSGERLVAGLLVGAAVASHWLLDLVVHVPDLPIIYNEPKVGFGLWRSLFWSQIAEFGLLLVGFALYLRSTRAKDRWGEVAPWALLGVLVSLQVYNLTVPVDPSQSMVALGMMGIFAYTLLAFAAALTARYRHAAPRPAPATTTAPLD